MENFTKKHKVTAYDKIFEIAEEMEKQVQSLFSILDRTKQRYEEYHQQLGTKVWTPFNPYISESVSFTPSPNSSVNSSIENDELLSEQSDEWSTNSNQDSFICYDEEIGSEEDYSDFEDSDDVQVLEDETNGFGGDFGANNSFGGDFGANNGFGGDFGANNNFGGGFDNSNNFGTGTGTNKNVSFGFGDDSTPKVKKTPVVWPSYVPVDERVSEDELKHILFSQRFTYTGNQYVVMNGDISTWVSPHFRYNHRGPGFIYIRGFYRRMP